MSFLMSPDFASLQLTLVDRFVELGFGSISDGVHGLTNFQRRLGIGSPSDPSANPEWVELLRRIDAAPWHDARVAIVIDAASSRPLARPEHIVRGWPTVGAFSIEVSGTTARTHFYSMDDDVSPLHPTRLDTRRHELLTVLAAAHDDHPELTHVAGGSWLYSTSSYASLFPTTHVANAVVRRGRRTFQGMSHWGQFLDHRGNQRSHLAAQFRERVRTWHGDDPCALFPIDTLEVTSPLSAFDLPVRGHECRPDRGRPE